MWASYLLDPHVIGTKVGALRHQSIVPQILHPKNSAAAPTHFQIRGSAPVHPLMDTNSAIPFPNPSSSSPSSRHLRHHRIGMVRLPPSPNQVLPPSEFIRPLCILGPSSTIYLTKIYILYAAQSILLDLYLKEVSYGIVFVTYSLYFIS